MKDAEYWARQVISIMKEIRDVDDMIREAREDLRLLNANLGTAREALRRAQENEQETDTE